MNVREYNVTLLRDKLIDDMRRMFDRDKRRIEHALAVLEYAERIQAVERGDPLVVTAAAILHDIGIRQAAQKYGSSAGKYQEIEGPPIAEEILKRHNIPTEAVEHICRIIANHHSAREIDTTEFRIVWDADWLVNIPADLPDASKADLQKIIN